MSRLPIRAAVCREFNKPLSIEKLHLAHPRAGEVQVQILASAICHSDIHFFENAWGGTLPAVWGHEAAGIVERVGDGVVGVSVGDRVVVTLIRSCGSCRNCSAGISVACTGTLNDHGSPLTDGDGRVVAHGLGTAAFAERAVVDQSQVVVIDSAMSSEISMESACLLACGVITGVGAATNTAQIEAGSSVAVIGCGGVGLNAIQGARLQRASTIIAVDLSEEKLAVSTEFGATHTVNSADRDLVRAITDITAGAMVDYVLVTVGAAGPLEQAPRLLAPNGTAVIVGMPATGVTTTIDPGTLAALNQSILGSKMGTSTIRDDIPELVAAYADGRLLLDELITGTYPIEQINEAIASVKNGQAIRNVIVFDHPTTDEAT